MPSNSPSSRATSTDPSACDALGHFEAQRTRHQRRRTRERHVVEARQHAPRPSDLQDIAKAAGGDQRQRARRVAAASCWWTTVVPCTSLSSLPRSGSTTCSPWRTPSRLIGGGGWHLGHAQRLRARVEQHHVGERATDVDAGDQLMGHDQLRRSCTRRNARGVRRESQQRPPKHRRCTRRRAFPFQRQPSQERRAVVARNFDEVAIADAESLRDGLRNPQRQPRACVLLRRPPGIVRTTTRCARKRVAQCHAWRSASRRRHRAMPRRRSSSAGYRRNVAEAHVAHDRLGDRAPADRRSRRRPRCARSPRRRVRNAKPVTLPGNAEGSTSSPSRSTREAIRRPGPAASDAIRRDQVLVGEHRERACSPSTRISRCRPSPPRWRPGPPPSWRSVMRSTRNGQLASSASIGWIDEMSPSAKLRIVLLPSAPDVPPVPPAGNSTKRKSPAAPDGGR